MSIDSSVYSWNFAFRCLEYLIDCTGFLNEADCSLIYFTSVMKLNLLMIIWIRSLTKIMSNVSYIYQSLIPYEFEDDLSNSWDY